MLLWQTFSGLAPIEGERTPSPTRAAVCVNAALRKGDIRPLRTPVATTRPCEPDATVLLEDPTTGTVHSGSHGDGIAVDDFAASGAYMVLDGVPNLFSNGVAVAPFYPEAPTQPPSVQVSPNLEGGQYGIGDELTAVSAQPRPGAAPPTAEPGFIMFQTRIGTPTRQTSAAAFLAAMDWVLANYTIDAYPGSSLGTRSLSFVLGEMINNIDAQVTFTRTKTGSPEIITTTDWSNAKTQAEETLKGFITALVKWTCKELFGVWLGSAWVTDFPVMLQATTDIPDQELALVQWFTPTAPTNPAGYAPGTSVLFADTSSDDGAWLLGVALGSLWRDNNAGYDPPQGWSAVRYVASLLLAEAESARANPAYVWYGLGTSTLAPSQYVPFVVGTDSLNPNTEAYSAPVPRAYCYTYVDSTGRESRPSPPVTLTGEGELGAAHYHAVSCPVSGAPAMVNIYRRVTPHGATNLEAIKAEWTLADMVTPAEAQAGVAIDFTRTGYTVLDTLHDADGPPTPRFLSKTSAGHAVCTNDQGTIVYISKRHKLWTYPYNRRLVLPPGMYARKVVVSDMTIYVLTDTYPIVYVLGEDHADDGLQVDDYELKHAPFGVYPATAVDAGWGVLYWSRVGVIALSGANVSVISMTLLDDDQIGTWAGTQAAVYWQGMYFSWRADGVCVMLDVPDKTFGEVVKAPMTTADVRVTGAVVTQQGELLLATDDDVLYDWGADGGTPLVVHYRTALTRLTTDAVFTAAKVQGAAVDGSFKVYDSRGLRSSRRIKGDRPFRLAPNRCRDAVAVEFIGTCEYISAFELSTSMGELAGT